MMVKRFQVLFLSIAVIACALLASNEIGRGRQYHLGMTISEVQLLTGDRYPTKKFALDYDQPPTPQQMNDDAIYYIYIEKEGIMLSFNHREKLIHKTRIKILGINRFMLMDSIRLLTKRLGITD